MPWPYYDNIKSTTNENQERSLNITQVIMDLSHFW